MALHGGKHGNRESRWLDEVGKWVAATFRMQALTGNIDRDTPNI